MGKFENSKRASPSGACAHRITSVAFLWQRLTAKRRLLWPGQRQFYLKSASDLRSTAICRPSFNLTRVHLLRFMASADGLPSTGANIFAQLQPRNATMARCPNARYAEYRHSVGLIGGELVACVSGVLVYDVSRLEDPFRSASALNLLKACSL